LKRYALSSTQGGLVTLLLPDRHYQLETLLEYKTKDKYKGWVVKIKNLKH